MNFISVKKKRKEIKEAIRKKKKKVVFSSFNGIWSTWFQFLPDFPLSFVNLPTNVNGKVLEINRQNTLKAIEALAYRSTDTSNALPRFTFFQSNFLLDRDSLETVEWLEYRGKENKYPFDSFIFFENIRSELQYFSMFFGFHKNLFFRMNGNLSS